MCLDNLNYEWYAVYTRVNQEKKIKILLDALQIESYLPLKRTQRQWCDRKKWIDEPLFRCYIFVRVSYREFFKVLEIPGVIVYVTFGNKPQSIPDFQIENIKTLVKQEQSEIIITRDLIAKGIKVKVCYGALQGVQGELIESCGQSRILIRLETMGCALYTNISKDEVKIVPSNSENGNRKQSRPKFVSKRKSIINY